MRGEMITHMGVRDVLGDLPKWVGFLLVSL